MNIKHLSKSIILQLGSVLFRNHNSKILYYHDVCIGKGYKSLDTSSLMGTSIELFKEHIKVIHQEGYKIVPKISNNYGEVSIMFDDGFRGIWENRKFFYDNNIRPTVFLPVSYVGQVDKGILSLDEILELQNHGFIFESHGWTHDSMECKSKEELVKELGESKKYLSRFLHKQITELCLPVGYFSDFLISEIKKYEYETIYCSIPGNFCDKIHGILTPRILCQFATPREIKYFLRGGGEILKHRYVKQHYKLYSHK